MNCKKCGKEISDRATFCESCRSKVEDLETINAQE